MKHSGTEGSHDASAGPSAPSRGKKVLKLDSFDPCHTFGIYSICRGFL